MEATHEYEVEVNWLRDRIGNMSSTVLDSTIEVATPPEFAKGVAGIWSPEHLLVAAVNSCLMTTFLAIAENSKLEFTHFSSRAVGKLTTVEGKLMINEITLFPKVLVSQENALERAERVLQKSEKACLISNSVKATIHMQTEVSLDENKMELV
ncbi:MAG: OsmC family peroxiredoxin [Cytophagales bacterium]|nr:MAG: OsmC family peroxiredoxin [Cytophagales bacterium]